MKHLVAVALVALAALAAAARSHAQDAAMIEAARKEGKVVWYTSLAIPSSTALAH
jgi:hypothetical protein